MLASGNLSSPLDLHKVVRCVAKEVDRKRRDIVQILKDLIQFRSINPFLAKVEKSEEMKCQRYIAEFLQQLGWEVELWEPDPRSLGEKYAGTPGYVPGHVFDQRPNLLAKSPGAASHPGILLTGHIDVVPATEEGWNFPPFEAVEQHGQIYGRGSVDMKGGIAAMLGALSAIKSSGIGMPPGIWFSTVVDEEAGGMGTLALVDHIIEQQLPIGAAILGEPTDLAVAPLSRGILWGEIVIKGRSGHIEVEQPHWRNGGAVDAIQKMLKVCKAIEWLNDEWSKAPGKSHPLLPRPCRIEVAQIIGGHSPTSFADECRITINVQYLPSERDEAGGGSKVRNEIETFIREFAKLDSWLKETPPMFTWLIDADSYEISPSHPFVKLCMEGMRLVGLHAHLRGVETHTDAGRLGYDAGIPTVILGPGETRLAHQVNERLDITHLCNAAKAYAAIILLWLYRKPLKLERPP